MEQRLGRPGRSPWHARPCQRPLGLAAASPPASAHLVAAPAPGPSWDSLLSRQRALARTIVMLIIIIIVIIFAIIIFAIIIIIIGTFFCHTCKALF